ncbi:hypothetical protein [uncultured Anaerococcus sp.]|uniref:hypothetical protein n=1 Tax=uncultured Anaerococcus sp. TaxID=293428 RepID=UPI0026210FE5|nr:hypothetical protein [uncultured Anaerococcus sp.]
MRIQVRTVVYREYVMNISPEEVENLGGFEDAIRTNMGYHNETTKSDEIIIDKTVLPEDQKDFEYMKEIGVKADKIIEDMEYRNEMDNIYQSEIKLEEDGKVAF